MKKITKKQWIILGVTMTIVLISVLAYFVINRERIIFKDNETFVEYGKEFSYESCIDKKVPEELKVKFPDLEIKEVGIYEVLYLYGKNKPVNEAEHTIIVQDTTFPEIELNHSKKVQVHVNRDYDPFSNIKTVSEIGEEALKNKKIISLDEYEKLIKDYKKESKKLNERVIKSKEDLVPNKLQGNILFATTNLNTKKLGEYKIQVAAVDSNFNITEIEWKIEVVGENEILNTGGNVVCSYPANTIPETDAVVSSYKETYIYDENALVVSASFETNMKMKDLYDSDGNLLMMMDKLHAEYDSYNDIKGVSVTITPNGTSASIVINIDLSVYDLNKDPIGIVKEKNQSLIGIKETLNNLKERGISCIVN